MRFLKLRTRKKIMFFLLTGIFLLLIGTGNFYIGYTKSIEHQEILQTLITKNNIQVSDVVSMKNGNIPYKIQDESLIRNIKKTNSRVNYYKIASIGGTIFILVGLSFIFIVLYLRL